jgi:aspartokinase
MNAERDLGPQPLGALLERHQLRPTDLVRASGEQLTHKMVARALKGRRLTRHTAEKVLRAVQAALRTAQPEAEAQPLELSDLFNYRT